MVTSFNQQQTIKTNGLSEPSVSLSSINHHHHHHHLRGAVAVSRRIHADTQVHLTTLFQPDIDEALPMGYIWTFLFFRICIFIAFGNGGVKDKKTRIGQWTWTRDSSYLLQRKQIRAAHQHPAVTRAYSFPTRQLTRTFKSPGIRLESVVSRDDAFLAHFQPGPVLPGGEWT